MRGPSKTSGILPGFWDFEVVQRDFENAYFSWRDFAGSRFKIKNLKAKRDLKIPEPLQRGRKVACAR